jgi:hypothetical protein
MKYFNKLGCPKVTIPYDLGIMRAMIKAQAEKPLCVNGEVKNQLLKLL